MILAEFKKQAKKEQVSTCNGWGFGGYYGDNYTLGNLRFRNAKWSYRHSGTSSYNGYFIDDKEVTKKEFLDELEKTEIKAILKSYDNSKNLSTAKG